MRVIANENVAGTAIRGLRRNGHDVLSVKESMQGAEDESILQRAEAEQRLVVTHDKDFGELASTGIDYLPRAESSCSACQVLTPPRTSSACWMSSKVVPTGQAASRS